jgi:phosphoglycolate phosphatase
VEKISVEEFKNNWVQPFIKFYDKYIPGISLEEEQKVYTDLITTKEVPENGSYSGMVDIILKLKQGGIDLWVVSGDSRKTILLELKEYGLEDVFSGFYYEVHDKTDKVKEIIEKNNLDKEQTAFIGDSNHEIEVSGQTGIKSIAVTWGFSTEERLKALKPDYLVHNIKELEEILL